MHIISDARSSANARDSCMSPSDLSSVSTSSSWDRTGGCGREKLDHRFGVERDRDRFLRKEWSLDNRSCSYRSSSSFPASSYGVSGSLNGKRRPSGLTGRHGPVESGRYGSTFVRSPSENGRDGFTYSGGPSPGYNSSSPSAEKHMKDKNGIHFRDIHLSPGDSISPSYDPSPRYGNQNDSETNGIREDERLKSNTSHYTWEPISRDRDCRERSLNRTDLYRRAYDLPKIDLTSDWNVEDKEVLEGRIDRYGNASIREQASLEAYKDQSRNEWGTRGRGICNSVLSSRMPACMPKPSLRDIGNSYVRAGVLGTRSPAHDDIGILNSLREESTGDEVVGNLKKRPRLTWGQGLAKYEKEKTVDDPSGQKKSDEYSHEGEGSTMCDTPRPCAQNEDVYSHPSCWRDEQIGNADATNNDVQREQCHTSSPQAVAAANNNDVTQEEPCYTPLQKSLTCSSTEESMETFAISPTYCTMLGSDANGTLLVSAPSASAFPSSIQCIYKFLESIQGKSPSISKDTLTQYVEKVEFEIDLVEKEIMKLEKEQDFITEYVEKVDLEIDLVKKEIIKLDNKDGIANVYCSGSGVNSSLDLSEPILGSLVSSIQGPSPDLKVALLHGDPPIKEMVTSTNSLTAYDKEVELVEEGNKTIELDGSSVKENVVFIPSISSSRSSCLVLDNAEDIASSEEWRNAIRECEDDISSLLLLNKGTARETANALSHLYPACIDLINNDGSVYACPQEAEVWKRNAENHHKKRKFLESKIIERRENSKMAEKALVIKYRVKRELWKCQQTGHLQKNWNIDPCVWSPVQRGSDASSLQQCSNVSGSGIVEANTKEILIARELLRMLPSKNEREFLRMPPMNLGNDQKNLHCFETKNGLIDDPIAAEQERKILNPWSSDEKKIFLEKYLLLGKNLRKIATFLEHKTVADCVQFYYLNQKSEDFQKIRHRHLLKKRRDSRSSALYLSRTTLSNRQCEMDTQCLEGLSLVAAAAAAMSSPNGIRASEITNPNAYWEQSLNKQASSMSGLVSNTCSEEQIVSKKSRKWNNRSFRRLNEEHESQWTDAERDLYLKALPMFGKDFHNIALYIGTKSQAQCKSFFSKARKRLGLDKLVEHYLAAVQAVHKGKENAECTDTFKVDPIVKMEQQHEKLDRFSPDVNEVLHKTPQKELQREDDFCVNSVLKPLLEMSDTNVSGVKEVKSVLTVDSPIDKRAAIDVDSVRICCNNQMTFDESLVCEEILHLKTEPLKVKKEHLSSSNGTDVPHTASVSLSHDIPTRSISVMSTPPVLSSQVKERCSKGSETRTRREPTSWTQEEKDIFVDVLKTHGKNWERLRESLPAKSLTQIKTYFQNSKAKLSLGFEGFSSGNGRGSSFKRKADDSNSNTNTAFGEGNTAQKASIPSADVSLNACSSIVPPSNSFGRNLCDTVELTQGLSAGILSSVNSPLLGPSSSPTAQQSYVHTPSIVIQSQQPISPMVVLHPASSTDSHEPYQQQSIVRPNCVSRLQSVPLSALQLQQMHQMSESVLQPLSLPQLQPRVEEGPHSFHHDLATNNLSLTSSQGVVMQFASVAECLPPQQCKMFQSQLCQVHSKPPALPQQTNPLINEQHQQRELAVLKQCTQSTAGSETSMPCECDHSLTLAKSPQSICLDMKTPPVVPDVQQPSNSDIKLFGQSLLLKPVSSNPKTDGKARPASPPALIPSRYPINTTAHVHNNSLNLEQMPLQSIPGFVNGSLSNDLENRDHEMINSSTRTAHGDDRLNLVQDERAYSDVCTELVKGVHSDPESLSCGQPNESSTYLNTTTANKNRVQECTSFSPATNGHPIVAQGLPRVIDALVALAEWRLQNSGGGSGKLTDEFLNQSWEALQRDPSSFLDLGKVNGTLAQLCSGRSEVLQHLKDRVIYAQSQHPQRHSVGNTAHSNDSQDMPSFHGTNGILVPDDTGKIEIRDVGGS